MIELAPQHKTGLSLKSPIMPASGCAGFASEYAALIDWSKWGAFVTNPVTARPRKPAGDPVSIDLGAAALVHTGIPNPGSGLEAIALRDGGWVMIYNDTERGRNSLAVSLSEDEGRSWKWTRHLEKGTGSYHYPSITQARDGTLHASYSFYPNGGQTIKHAHFNVGWIRQGD